MEPKSKTKWSWHDTKFALFFCVLALCFCAFALSFYVIQSQDSGTQFSSKCSKCLSAHRKRTVINGPGMDLVENGQCPKWTLKRSLNMLHLLTGGNLGSRPVISSWLQSVEKGGTWTSVVPAGSSQSKSTKTSLANTNILRSLLRIMITYHAVNYNSISGIEG